MIYISYKYLNIYRIFIYLDSNIYEYFSEFSKYNNYNILEFIEYKNDIIKKIIFIHKILRNI